MSHLTIKQKIAQELDGKKPEEIHVLDLSGCTGVNFEGLTDKFVNLTELIAKGCGLKSTEGLPPLKSLVTIDLSNNNISDLKAVAALPSLLILDLVDNKIEKPEVIKVLFDHPKLECINLEGNDVKETDGFLDELFTNMPFLCSVDGVNNAHGSTIIENGEEYDDDEEDEYDEDEDSEDGIGLKTLQQSGELEDDEEDFNPEDDNEYDEEDEEEDDDEEEEGDDDEVDDSNVVDEKIGKKRKAVETNGSGDAKHKRVSETNGADDE